MLKQCAHPDADPDADPHADPNADPDADPEADPDAYPDADFKRILLFKGFHKVVTCWLLSI